MAVRTTALIPYSVNNIPDRFTPVYATDDTAVVTTTSTVAAIRINRLQTATFKMATNVIEVTEMGSQLRPGGVDDLGEVSFSLDWASVGITNIATLTGTTVSQTAGATTTIGSPQMNAATLDLVRMVADSTGTIFGTLYCQDLVITDYKVDAKENGLIMEGISGKGPNATFFPGFVLPKIYVATSTDVTNGYLSISSIFGSNEQAVQIFLPNGNQPGSYWQQNGASYFLKIEKVPGGVTTNPLTRYFENVVVTPLAAVAISSTAYVTLSGMDLQATRVGQVITAGLGTANVENVTITNVASIVNTTNTGTITAGAGVVVPVTGGTTGIQVGVTLTVDTVASGVRENVTVTAVSAGVSFTATFAHNHAAGVTIFTTNPSIQGNFTKTHTTTDPFVAQLTAAQGPTGQAAYIATSNRIYTGDTLVAGDVYRLVCLSYNTNGYPLTVPSAAPDTTDRPGVNSRLVPFNIGAGTTSQTQVNRVQSASYALSMKRDQVQGVGENSIAYGVSSVPDVSISFDVKETDTTLINQLQNQSKNLTGQGGTIANDFIDLNYATRLQLATPIISTITLADPYNSAKILCTWQSPQIVQKDLDFSSTAKGDNTVKVTAMDIQGLFTISYTAPL